MTKKFPRFIFATLLSNEREGIKMPLTSIKEKVRGLDGTDKVKIY
jgi:hypothetical protein